MKRKRLYALSQSVLPGPAELPPCLPGSEAQGSFVLSDAGPHSVVYLFPTISQEMWRGVKSGPRNENFQNICSSLVWDGALH